MVKSYRFRNMVAEDLPQGRAIFMSRACTRPGEAYWAPAGYAEEKHSAGNTDERLLLNASKPETRSRECQSRQTPSKRRQGEET